MEEVQRLVIVTNLDKLIRLTNCSELFLSHLSSKDILSEADVQLVKSKSTQLSKSSCLYDILLTRQGSYDALEVTLESTRQTGALHILNNSKDSVETDANKKLLWNIPDPLSSFQGRVSELWELHSVVFNTNPTNNHSCITIVHGTIGVGKTELCIQYLHNIKRWNANLCNHALFFRCHHIQTIEEDVRLISETLFGYKHKVNMIEDTIEDIFLYVANNKSNCFFIYDGCNDPTLLKMMIPKSFKSFQMDGFSCPKIVVTSQISNLDTSIKNRLCLSVLKSFDAFSYANKRLERLIRDTQVAQTLCTKLSNHPLALENALSYILEERISANEIQEFVNNLVYSVEPFSKRYEQVERTYLSPFVLAWGNLLENIKQQQTLWLAALNVLQFIAYIGCNQNSFEFLKLIFTNKTLEDAKRILCWHNIISYTKATNDFEIADILRVFVRSNLESNQGHIKVLSIIMARLIDADEPKKDLYYEAWRHGCRHESIVSKFFSYKKLSEELTTPLHIFIKHNDFFSVKMLIKHFEKGRKRHLLCKIIQPKECSELKVKLDQKEVILELKQQNFILRPCDKLHMAVHMPYSKYNDYKCVCC